MLDVGGDDEHVRAGGAGEHDRGEVLVDDGLDALDRAVGQPHHRYAAATGSDDDVPRREQGEDGVGVEDLERLG